MEYDETSITPSLELQLELNYGLSQGNTTTIKDEEQKSAKESSNASKRKRKRKQTPSERRHRRNKHCRRVKQFDYSNEQDIGSASIRVALQSKNKKEENCNDNFIPDSPLNVDVDNSTNKENTVTEKDEKWNTNDRKKNFVNIHNYLSKTIRKHGKGVNRNPDHEYTSWPWGMPHHSLSAASSANLYRTCRFLIRIATRLLLLSPLSNNILLCQALDLLHRVPALFNPYFLQSKYIKSEKDDNGIHHENPIEFLDDCHGEITTFKSRLKRQLTHQVNVLLHDTTEYKQYKKKEETKQEQIMKRNFELQECANMRERNAFASYFKCQEDSKVESKQEDDDEQHKAQNDEINGEISSIEEDEYSDDDLFLAEEEIDKLNFSKEQKDAHEKLSMNDVYPPKGIDTSTIILTTSHLLSKYLQNNNNANQGNEFEEIDKYLRTCMKITSPNKLKCRESTLGPKPNRALVLSLIQSLYTILSPIRLVSNEEEEDDVVSSLRNMAVDLVNIGNTYRNDESLLRFTDLHITTALAQLVLCTFIPNSIVISLSKPLDLKSTNRRTPFDIFQTMFTILDPFTSDDELHEFITGFEKSIEIIQLNLNQLPFECISTSVSWYLGIACSIMVASCGIFTIAQKQDEYEEDDLFIDLDVFDKYRKKVLHLLQRIVSFASATQDQQNVTAFSEYSSILSSFFEWKQVLYVLYGNYIHDNEDNEDIFSSISNMYSYHTYQCCLYLSCDNINYKQRIQELVYNQCISIEYYKSFIANQIESDCDDIDYWIELVSLLGPIGTKIKHDENDEDNGVNNSNISCGELNCLQCQLLKPGLVILHEEIDKLKNSKLWWGMNRQWWYPMFLCLPINISDDDTSNCANEIITKKELRNKILKHLSTFNKEMFEFDREESKTASHKSLDDNDVTFIQLNTTSIHNSDHNFLFHYASYSSRFPKQLSEVIHDVENKEFNNKFNNKKAFEIPITLSPSSTTCLEITYKIVIACHLHTLCHSFVNDGIQFLLDQCCSSLFDDCFIDDDLMRIFLESNESFVCLCWLQSMGLDANNILEWNACNDS